MEDYDFSEEFFNAMDKYSEFQKNNVFLSIDNFDVSIFDLSGLDEDYKIVEDIDILIEVEYSKRFPLKNMGCYGLGIRSKIEKSGIELFVDEIFLPKYHDRKVLIEYDRLLSEEEVERYREASRTAINLTNTSKLKIYSEEEKEISEGLDKYLAYYKKVSLVHPEEVLYVLDESLSKQDIGLIIDAKVIKKIGIYEKYRGGFKFIHAAFSKLCVSDKFYKLPCPLNGLIMNFIEDNSEDFVKQLYHDQKSKWRRRVLTAYKNMANIQIGDSSIDWPDFD